MKKLIKQLTAPLLLIIYALIAGGSIVETIVTWGVIIGVPVALILGYSAIIDIRGRKKGLKKATNLFGDYTQKLNYKFDEYILYDENTHRILLNEDIIADTRKLKELKVLTRDPKTTVTYKEETVTTTKAGSAIGRGIVGALVAGPVGAVIGGATAKQETTTSKVPEEKTLPGWYKITVIDFENKERAYYIGTDLKECEKLRIFLQNIIDKNYEAERLALQIAKVEKENAIKSFNPSHIIIGAEIASVNELFINSLNYIKNGCNIHKLCPELIAVINSKWQTKFENIEIVIKDDILVKFSGISKPHFANNFQNLILEERILEQKIEAIYGEPKKLNLNIAYTNFTDDNNRINVCKWNVTDNKYIIIDYTYMNGKLYYELISEIQ